jgi:D-psicose/D-tagatose/L-ribulose 3-epimerase
MSLQISFGVTTWLWTSPFTTAAIHDILPKVKAMGFDAIEIALEDPALVDGNELKHALDAHGLQAVVCGAFGPTRDFTHDDIAVHENCFNYLRACFTLCNTLGTSFVAGPIYSAVGKARMVPADQRKREWKLAVKNLHSVCKMADEQGLQIALEPLNRFESDLVNTAADVVRLVNDINHPAAKIMLDGFHMNIEERDMERAIITAGDKLIHFQVSENYRGTPGTGQTQWAAIKRGLQAINYKGAVSIESFTPDNKELAGAVCFWHPMAENQDDFAREGLRFLKELFED